MTLGLGKDLKTLCFASNVYIGLCGQELKTSPVFMKRICLVVLTGAQDLICFYTTFIVWLCGQAIKTLFVFMQRILLVVWTTSSGLICLYKKYVFSMICVDKNSILYVLYDNDMFSKIIIVPENDNLVFLVLLEYVM